MDTGMTFTVVLPADALPVLRTLITEFSENDILFQIVREQRRLGARKSEVVVDICIDLGKGVAASLIAAAIYSLVTSHDPAPEAPECRVIVHEKVIILNKKKKEEVITEIEMAVGKCR
jgi:hypothetical protein